MIETDQPPAPRPTRKRWWRWAVAALVVCVVLAAVVVHLPFVRTWALSQIVATLARQGVRLDADRFRYNLLTLTVAMDHVTVAAGDRTPPFLEIDAVEVNLPWSVVTGRFIAESVVITRPRVTLVRGADGRLNVPDFGSDDGPAFEGPIVIGRLLVSELALAYDDVANGRRIDARGLTLDMRTTALAPLGGTLGMAEAATIEWAGHATSINSLAGTLTFDGTTATMSDLAIQMPEGTLRVNGPVDALGADPQMTLRYDARVDAGRGASWFDVAPAPTGVILLTGAIEGDRDAPRVTAAVASEGVTWSTLDVLSLEARVSFANSTLAIETSRVGMAGGELTTAGNVALGADGASTLNADWRDINLARLLTIVPDLTVRPGALSNGTLAMAWTGTDILGGRATVTTTQRALEPRSAVMPIGGSLALSTEARRWTLTGTPTVAGALEVKVHATGQFADPLSRTPLDGAATVAVVDLAEALHQLETVGILPDLGERDAFRGVASVEVDLRGTLGAPRATGTVDGRDMAFFGTGPASLTTRFDATARTVTLDDLRLDVGANTLAAQATLGIAANSLAGSLQAELPDLTAISGSLPPEWRPSGSAIVAATFGGALDNPVVDVQMTSDALRMAGQVIDTVESRIQILDRVATIQSLEVTQGDGRLTATGRYAFEDGQYTFTADGTGLEISPIVTAGASGVPAESVAPGAATTIPLRTRLDLQFRGEGTAAAPQAAGAVQFAHVDWGAYRLGPATADVALADGRARVQADLPLMKGSVDAAIALESGHINAVATLADAEIATLARASGPAGPAPAAGTTDPAAAGTAAPVVAGEPGPADAAGDDTVAEAIPLTGTIRLQATVEGLLDDIAAMTVAVEVNLTDATVNGVPVRVERTARVRHEGGVISADDVTLELGDVTLTARGRLGPGTTPDDGLNVALAGTLIELTPLLQLAPGFEDVTIDGSLDVLLHASGPLDTPDLTAYMTLTGGILETPDMPPATNIAMAATYTAGIANVSHISAAWQGAELLALGYAPLSLLGDRIPERYRANLPPMSGPARFDVRVTNLTSDALTPLLEGGSTGQITGRVDLAADVQATALSLDSLSAEVRLDRADVELARVPLAQTRPTRLRLVNRQLDIVDWNWVGEGNNLTVDGHVMLGEEATALDLGVNGSLDLRMITAVVPSVATAGRATIAMSARGTTAEPVVEGQIAFDDVDFILRDPRVAITEMTGGAVFSRNRVTIDGITANANGGTVAITGGLDYSDFAISEGTLTFTGRDLAIEAFEGLRTELNTDLTLSMTKNVPSLGGRVTIVRGDYREPLSLTEQVFATLETRTSGPDLDDDNEGMLSRLRLDIAVVSDEDIVVDNNYGRLEIGSNLRVTGTATAPILGGRLAMREGGVIYLGGQTYTLQRGTVDFTNATRIEPDFDIALETRVQSNDITLQLRGTPQDLDVSARSPGLSQQDAVSMLLTGQRAEGAMAYTDVARGQLLMLLSGELLGTAGRAVGLDMVQVSRGLGGAASSFDLLATDSDPDARLTIAKNLSPELEMIVSQSLRDTGDITWIAVYRPHRRLEFRFATDDDSQETYEFRHEMHLGGERTAAPARPPQPRIAAVHIEGASTIPNADLLSELDLGVGDRFDYFDWQRDRDRLADLFHDRGYFEARISARRRDEAPGEVTLAYEIEPGPRTVLRVQGFTLPRDVTEAIEAAWTQSVFDGFLVDDAEALARRAVVRAQHLQGTVEATVTQTADGTEKQLTVSIVPGPRSTTRQFDFNGNERVSDDTLKSLVEAQDNGVAAWMAPADVEAAIEAYYRSLGHLTAAVTVDDVRFEADAATLPVRIDEGPAYRIGFVGVSGAAFRTAEAVRTVTGLESGAPYRPAAIEPARRAVEVDYLGAGYNDVRVSALVGVDEERGLADVVIAVFEGPQQILQDVTASGARITSSGTITNALRLEPGVPLNMTALYAAQKRLYDTSVFQSVDFSVEPVETGTSGAPGTQAVRALVTVQELPRYRLRYGIRVSDSTGPAEGTREISPALVVDLMNRNLFGRAIAAGVAGQIEADRRLARGIVSLPSLLGLPAVTSLFLTQSRQDIGPEEEGSSPYVEDETDFTIEQRFRPTRTMSVTYGYSLSRKKQFEREPDPDSFFPPRDVQVRVAKVTGTYAWDRRDDASNASRGWFHSSGLEYAPRGIGSELRFVRYLAQQYYFHPVGDHTVLASAMRVGLGDGLGEETGLEETLLSSVRFFAGGASSVRGFREDSIGGRDIFGFPIGGNALLVLNQEIRFPIFRWFRGVAFIDAGNVYPTVGDLSFTDLESGAGVGLRLTSPFAIIRFDYGIPLTSRDTEHNRWYFAIGQTF